VAAKAKAASRPIIGDVELLLRAQPHARVLAITGTNGKATGGVYVEKGKLYDDSNGQNVLIVDLATAKSLPGAHNWQNAAAAYAAMCALGLQRGPILYGIRYYPGLAHRQELIATIAGIRYINDSKATNADATQKALVCYEPIYWILGGKPKEGGIESLKPLFPRIAHAYLIGEASADFARSLNGHVAATECGTLDRAVAAAHAQAQADRRPGAVVLLSPACASFDQFANFEQRGEAFRRLVLELGAGGGPRGAS
jgi:UDP-N-acetylmuramoylalanine--D-glutamate ligase